MKSKNKIMICGFCFLLLLIVSEIVRAVFQIDTTNTLAGAIGIFIMMIPIECGLFFISQDLSRKNTFLGGAIHAIMILISIPVIGFLVFYLST